MNQEAGYIVTLTWGTTGYMITLTWGKTKDMFSNTWVRTCRVSTRTRRPILARRTILGRRTILKKTYLPLSGLTRLRHSVGPVCGDMAGFSDTAH